MDFSFLLYPQGNISFKKSHSMSFVGKKFAYLRYTSLVFYQPTFTDDLESQSLGDMERRVSAGHFSLKYRYLK